LRRKKEEREKEERKREKKRMERRISLSLVWWLAPPLYRHNHPR